MRPRLRRRNALALAILAGVGIVVVGQQWPKPFEQAGAELANAASPAVSVADEALRVAGTVWFGMRGLLDRQREMERLRRENERLHEWRAEAERLEWENASLRALTEVRPQPAQRSLTAQVIGGASGPFQHSVLADAGEEEGVRDGAPVVDGHGLVGRVTDVASHSARILLLTDINSRVPVVLRESGARAILAGDGSDLPVLVLLSSRADIQTGEWVVTSGHGGLYANGMAVGRVEDIRPDEVRVAPFARLGTLGFVRILEPRGEPSFASPTSIIAPAAECPCASPPKEDSALQDPSQPQSILAPRTDSRDHE